jgi:RloB-like protein
LNVRIKPELPTKKTLADQFKIVKELAKDYEKTFWIIDLDVILKETREAKKGRKTKLQELTEYIKSINKNYAKSVVVIINNPCLEFWFLIHFEATTKYFSACADGEKQLKKYLPDYDKTRKYFTKEGSDIYLRLKSHLKTALTNAENLGRFNAENPTNALSEMDLFFRAGEFEGHF